MKLCFGLFVFAHLTALYPCLKSRAAEHSTIIWFLGLLYVFLFLVFVCFGTGSLVLFHVFSLSHIVLHGASRFIMLCPG